MSSRREREILRLRRMCAREMRQGTAHIFPSISIPSSFFLFFHGPSGPSTLAVSWHFGPASSPIPFTPDFSVIEPIQTPPIFSFSWLSLVLHSRTSHKSPTLLPFRHCVLYREKIRVPFVCCHTNNDNSSGIISFLFLSLSLAQFQ